jgi:hypothetical protein
MNRFDAFSRLSFYSPSPLLHSARNSQVERVRRFLRYDVLPKASLEGGASAGSRSGSSISGDDARSSTLEAISRGDNRQWMTGSELANLVERLVPRLNDVTGAARC